MIAESDKETVYQWIDSLSLSRPKRNIARDFSDAVLMAEVLKLHYPRIVELHSYVSASGKEQKIANWSLLNRKVLKKLNICLSRETIEKLATSQAGAVECLLKDVYDKIEADKKASSESEESSGNESDILSGAEDDIAAAFSKRKLHKKMVPVAVFNQKMKEIAEKEDIISKLTSKITHLESLVRLKDQRIKDLSAQLERSEILTQKNS